MTSFTSQITFLNFRDYDRGRDFMTRVLQLEPLYDIGWAVVYGIAGKAFLGVVDHSQRPQSPCRDGILISLTADRLEPWYDHVRAFVPVSPIREVPGAGLRSFFFTGPEGVQFEIQQFLPENRDACRLFG